MRASTIRLLKSLAAFPSWCEAAEKRRTRKFWRRTETLIQQGAAGIVYGRNVIQHQNPAGMTKALMAIVHDGASAADAARFLR